MDSGCQGFYLARSSQKHPIAGVNVTVNVSVRSRDPSQLAAGNQSASALPLPVPLQLLGEQHLVARFGLDLWMPGAPLLVDAHESRESGRARHTQSFSARRLVNFLSVATADECAPVFWCRSITSLPSPPLPFPPTPPPHL